MTEQETARINDTNVFDGPPVAGSELETLLGGLERQRSVFAWKVADLDQNGLTARIGASTITLGGLIKHLAFIEDLKFGTMLLGEDLPEPWNSVDWETDEDWPWHSAVENSPDELYQLWSEGVSRSRKWISRALEVEGLETQIKWGFDQPEDALSLRRLLVDVLEEYARHVGHADLLREAVDGRVGEDPPGNVYPYSPPTSAACPPRCQ